MGLASFNRAREIQAKAEAEKAKEAETKVVEKPKKETKSK